MRFLFAALAALATFAFGSAAYAQPMSAPERALRDIGVWAQAHNAFTAEMTGLFDRAVALDNIVMQFGSGSLKEDAAMAAIEAWRVEFQAEVVALRGRHAALPPPPQILGALGPDGRGLQAMLDNSAPRSRQMLDRIGGFGDAMAASTQALIADSDDMGAQLVRAMLLARELILFENESYSLVREMPGAGLNAHLASAQISLNEALLVCIDTISAVAEGDENPFPPARREAMLGHMQTLSAHIARGRAATAEARAMMRQQSLGYSFEMRQGMERILDSVNDSFSTLEGAKDLVEQAARGSDGDKIEPIFALLERIDLVAIQLQEQNAERARLVTPGAPTL